MSSSRAAGWGLTCSARSMRSSVVSPMAETMTTTSLPAFLVSTMRAATRLTLSASATEEPPYFWTTSPTVGVRLTGSADWWSGHPNGARSREPLRPNGGIYVPRSDGEVGPGGGSGAAQIAEHAPATDAPARACPRRPAAARSGPTPRRARARWCARPGRSWSSRSHRPPVRTPTTTRVLPPAPELHRRSESEYVAKNAAAVAASANSSASADAVRAGGAVPVVDLEGVGGHGQRGGVHRLLGAPDRAQCRDGVAGVARDRRRAVARVAVLGRCRGRRGRSTRIRAPARGAATRGRATRSSWPASRCGRTCSTARGSTVQARSAPGWTPRALGDRRGRPASGRRPARGRAAADAQQRRRRRRGERPYEGEVIGASASVDAEVLPVAVRPDARPTPSRACGRRASPPRCA